MKRGAHAMAFDHFFLLVDFFFKYCFGQCLTFSNKHTNNLTPWRDSNPGLLFPRRMRCPLRHAAMPSRATFRLLWRDALLITALPQCLDRRGYSLHQGCQMVYFQTKNHNLGKFSRVLQMANVGIF
jgi:hypothetical protein